MFYILVVLNKFIVYFIFSIVYINVIFKWVVYFYDKNFNDMLSFKVFQVCFMGFLIFCFFYFVVFGGIVIRVKLDQRKVFFVVSCWLLSDCQMSFVLDLFLFFRCMVNVIVIYFQL